jgi:hypothetical protein
LRAACAASTLPDPKLATGAFALGDVLAIVGVSLVSAMGIVCGRLRMKPLRDLNN